MNVSWFPKGDRMSIFLQSPLDSVCRTTCSPLIFHCWVQSKTHNYAHDKCVFFQQSAFIRKNFPIGSAINCVITLAFLIGEDSVNSRTIKHFISDDKSFWSEYNWEKIHPHIIHRISNRIDSSTFTYCFVYNSARHCYINFRSLFMCWFTENFFTSTVPKVHGALCFKCFWIWPIPPYYSWNLAWLSKMSRI
jgi:hypothetical protein